MIYVDRSKVPVPEILRSDRAVAARKKAEEFFSVPFAKRAQQRFEFDSRIYNETREDLARLFHGKCAYCESRLAAVAPIDVDHFRPKTQPVGLDPAQKPVQNVDGYWWLVYEWENLYAACPACNRNKRNRFPVVGRRAPWPSWKGTVAASRDERALLLDPCANEPERYLNFQVNGMVRPRGPADRAEKERFGGYHRGEVTIEILGLNRSELVKERERTAKEMLPQLREFQALLHLWGLEARSSRRPLVRREQMFKTPDWARIVEIRLKEDKNRPKIAELSRIFLDVEKPYLALRRQMLNTMLHEWSRGQEQNLDPARLLGFREGLGALREDLFSSTEQPAPPSPSRPARGSQEEKVAPPLVPSHKPFPKPPLIRKPRPTAVKVRAATKKNVVRKRAVRGVRTPYIQSIEIEDFKAIQKLRIEFPERVDRKVSWKVLLGENGTGKSTVLQAVALALMGPEYLKRQRVSPRPLLRKLPGGKRARKGAVRIQLSTEPHPLELRFTARGFVYERGLEDARVFLRAFGSTRRLPRGRGAGRVPKAPPLMRVDPLFDPGVYLCDASAWMRQLPKRSFDSAALTVKDLLNLESREPLKRMRSGVNASVGGVRVTLDELSDGYQSVLAMATDILAGAPEKLHDMRNAVGIVLLDEIDAHLHPRWKMRIVSSLRRAFPRLQFLVTTHEPLCLRGLEEKEITLMRRVGRKLFAEHDLPSPRGLRVDQILTSPFFGLGTTIDPEVDKDFMDYYALLLKPDEKLTGHQKELREQLKEKLKPYRILGTTRRDQLISEVIDEYLAKDLSTPNMETRRKLRQDTKRRVAEIWKQVDLLTEEA